MSAQRSVRQRLFFGTTLPSDVVDLIMLRLPAKSLVRFKGVDKSWKESIEKPSFEVQHTLRSSQGDIPDSFLLQTPDGFSYRFFYFNMESKVFSNYNFAIANLLWKNVSDLEFLASINGLMLLSYPKRNVSLHNYSVYNPTTKKERQISLIRGVKKIYGAVFEYDPRYSAHYRVIFLVTWGSFTDDDFDSSGYFAKFRVDIYNSSTKTFTHFYLPNEFNNELSISKMFLVDQKIYFVITYGDHMGEMFHIDLQYGGTVVRDDIPDIPRSYYRETLRNFVSRGKLVCTVVTFAHPAPYISVYQLTDQLTDSAVWVKKLQWSFESISQYMDGRYSNRRYSGRQFTGVVEVFIGECEEESWILIHVPGKAILLKMNNYFDILFEDPRFMVCPGRSQHFMETLAPV